MRILCVLTILLSFCSTLFSQLNPGFESVVSPPGSENTVPYDWLASQVSPQVYCTINPTAGYSSNESHTGDWCIKMEALDCTGAVLLDTFTFPGGFRTTNPDNVHPYNGHAYAERPDEFRFYYKFHQEGIDTGFVQVFLFNYDSSLPINERTDTVAFARGYIHEEHDTYVEFILPLNYLNEDFPSFADIRFLTSKYLGENPQELMTPGIAGTEGTTLWVDDVSFAGGTVSASNFYTDPGINIFPNPTTGSFQIEITEELEIQNIRLTDYQGREIRNFQPSASSFSMNGLPEGIYSLIIETDQGNLVQKILKK